MERGDVGLHIRFRKPKRKREGPQHFSFPEISKETRGCLVLHSGNSRVCLSLRAGLGQNLRRNREKRQHTGYFPGIPAKYPGILPIWLILGPNQLILGVPYWPLREFPATQRETRAQRVPSTLSFRKFPGNPEGVWCSIPAPFCLSGNSRVSSFPESESWFVCVWGKI